MRLSLDLFREMIERVGLSLEKGDTFMRKALRLGHMGICYGLRLRVPASTVRPIYGLLRSVADDYGRNEIVKHFENRATERPRRRKRDSRSRDITVMSMDQDGYPTDNP